MHLAHEAVVVRALAELQRQRLEEQVHQKSLAAANAAPEVQAAQGRLDGRHREAPQLRAQLVADGLRLLNQTRAQIIEPRGSLQLSRVELEPMRRGFGG